MDPNANRFRPVFPEAGEGDDRTELEGLHKQLQAQLTGQAVEAVAEELSKGTGRLVLADGSPVPAHWPVMTEGELVTVKDYGFRVAHIGPAHLLLEPTGPLLVGQDKPTVEPNPLASDLYYQRKLAEERLERCRVLWNAVAYLTTELSRAIGYQEGHSKPSSTARDVLRVAKVVQEGGPLGHQGPDLEAGVDTLSLSDLDRASGAYTREELARLSLDRVDAALAVAKSVARAAAVAPCQECGRLVTVGELESGAAVHELVTPDSEFTAETWRTLCPDHKEGGGS